MFFRLEASGWDKFMEGIEGIFNGVVDFGKGAVQMVQQLDGVKDEILATVSVMPAPIVAAVGSLITFLLVFALLKWRS